MSSVHLNRIGHHSARRGFSLVELMIVIVIIGILGGAALFIFKSAPEHARAQRAGAEISKLADAIGMYQTLNGGRLPTALEDLKKLDNQKVATEDPWGNPYVYEPDQDSGFIIRSDGKLQGDDSDDIYFTPIDGLVNKYAEKLKQENQK